MGKPFSLEKQRKYMRIPFVEHGRGFDGCDCGGLVNLVYKEELGVILPDCSELYRTTHIESFEELCATIGGLRDQFFEEVPKGQKIEPFDVAVWNIAGNPVHVGIAVNEHYFMHIMEGYTNVRQERFDSMNWQKRLEGIFRYVG